MDLVGQFQSYTEAAPPVRVWNLPVAPRSMPDGLGFMDLFAQQAGHADVIAQAALNQVPDISRRFVSPSRPSNYPVGRHLPGPQIPNVSSVGALPSYPACVAPEREDGEEEEEFDDAD